MQWLGISRGTQSLAAVFLFSHFVKNTIGIGSAREGEFYRTKTHGFGPGGETPVNAMQKRSGLFHLTRGTGGASGKSIASKPMILCRISISPIA